MRYLIIASLFALTACATDSMSETTKVLDCASIDSSFKQKGDTCASICVACEEGGGECLDKDKNHYGETCVKPANNPKTKCLPLTEVCNGKDDDCDSLVDEDLTYTGYEDKDGDGYGNPAVTKQICIMKNPLFAAEASAGYVSNALDCNDKASFANKHGKEICDGLDNDCNGVTDDHCDDDADGYCDTNMIYSDDSPCTPGDCNDTNASVHPGAEEICGNTINDNCDGYLNEGCTK